MTVRRLGTQDGATLREVRLRALRDAPDAFLATYDVEAAFPDHVWDGRLRQPGNANFVWQAGDGAAGGVVAFVRERPDAPVAWIVGMWVDPAYRSRGVADELIDAAVRAARDDGVRTLRLHVADGNVRAERVYARHGFAKTGGPLNAMPGHTAIETDVEMELETEVA